MASGNALDADHGAAYIQRPDGTALYFDLTHEERHTGIAAVTKLPVEEGPDISDHIRVEPSPFTLRCFISNTPLVPSGNQGGTKPGELTENVKSSVLVDITPYKAPFSPVGALASAVVNPVGAIVSAVQGDPGKKSVAVPVMMFPTDFNAPMDALFILKDMQDKSELLTVFTSLAEYENMVLERYELIKNAETGTGAEVEMFFVPLNIVKTETAPTPITTEPTIKKVKKAGKKDPEPVPEIKSVAANGVDKIAELMK